MRRKDAGFTLLEVMVAMSILATALVVVFQMQSQSISLSSESRFLTVASLLAAVKMADLEAQTNLTDQNSKGDFAPDYPEYAWTSRVTQTQIARLKKIEVQIFYKDMPTGETYQLVLYKLGGG